MARGNAQASQAATTAQKNSDQFTSNASGIYGTLAPQLTSQATAPQGFAPEDLAAINTGSQQSAGGGVSAAVGQGGLLAARLRNGGAPMAAIAQAAREGGMRATDSARDVQEDNARLRTSNQQFGMSGLENLYGQQVGGANASLGQVSPNVNADTQAKSQSWDWSRAILAPVLGAASNSKRF